MKCEVRSTPYTAKYSAHYSVLRSTKNLIPLHPTPPPLHSTPLHRYFSLPLPSVPSHPSLSTPTPTPTGPPHSPAPPAPTPPLSLPTSPGGHCAIGLLSVRSAA